MELTSRQKKIKKAEVVFMFARRTYGKICGLKTDKDQRSSKLGSAGNELGSVQRFACLVITVAMRNTTTLAPLHLKIKREVRRNERDR